MRMTSRVFERKLLDLQRTESRRLPLGQLVRRLVTRVVVAVVAAVSLRLVVMLMSVRQVAHRDGQAARERENTGEKTSCQGTEHEGNLRSRTNEKRGPAPRGLAGSYGDGGYQPGFCFSAGLVSRSDSGIG